MKTAEIEFIINRKILINSNMKLHYHDKANRARKLRELSFTQGETEGLNKFHFEKFVVDIYVYPPTRRRLDPPNLYPTVKHLIDGLTDLKVWDDDDYTHLQSMTFYYGGLSEIKDKFKIKIKIIERSEKK